MALCVNGEVAGQDYLILSMYVAQNGETAPSMTLGEEKYLGEGSEELRIVFVL